MGEVAIIQRFRRFITHHAKTLSHVADFKASPPEAQKHTSNWHKCYGKRPRDWLLGLPQPCVLIGGCHSHE